MRQTAPVALRQPPPTDNQGGGSRGFKRDGFEVIHTARNTGKFKRLIRRLRPLCNGPFDAETIAVGILERLWHATINNAPTGAIGAKLDDDEIAEEVGWIGPTQDLIDTLVETEWLDRCGVHRLVIHDWENHAPQFIKGNLSRHGKSFAIAVSSEDVALANSLSKLPPNLTKPNETQPDLTELNCQPVRAVSQEEFLEDWQEGIKPVAEGLKEYIEPKGRLSARNRTLALKMAAMAYYSPSLCSLITRLARENSEKRPDKPWGYFKASAIRVFKDNGLDFDLQWAAVDLPPQIASGKQESQQVA